MVEMKSRLRSDAPFIMNIFVGEAVSTLVRMALAGVGCEDMFCVVRLAGIWICGLRGKMLEDRALSALVPEHTPKTSSATPKTEGPHDVNPHLFHSNMTVCMHSGCASYESQKN